MKQLSLETINIKYPLQNWLHLYTNGSLISREQGAGVTCCLFSLHRYLGYGTTSFDGEIIAISESLRNLLCHINQFKNAIILSDSKAAILSIVSKHTSSSQTAEITKMLSQLISFNKRIVFQWIPSHCGILGNENADALAKKGSTATYRPVTKSTHLKTDSLSQDEHVHACSIAFFRPLFLTTSVSAAHPVTAVHTSSDHSLQMRINDAIDKLNEDIDSIVTWTKKFHLNINPGKTQAIILGHKRQTNAVKHLDISPVKNCQQDAKDGKTATASKVMATTTSTTPPPLTPISALGAGNRGSPTENSAGHSPPTPPSPPKLQRLPRMADSGKLVTVPRFVKVPKSRESSLVNQQGTKTTASKGTIVGSVTTWLPPSSTIQLSSSTGAKTSSPVSPSPSSSVSSTTNNTDPLTSSSTANVQAIARMGGKKYIVVPKHNVLSVCPAMAATATTPTAKSSVQMGDPSPLGDKAL
ncbi:hypothetical protein ANN_16853 [Periplaneta americana]|uniref:RNase H type-1 domain-containing protein n=1 Tax=Periplaneta americana TaxID=6978 RepID=A0ABQ8SRA1_PERAM|nr:hypothetical protein ANN_16853 [Periplaneta americana]